MGYLRPCSGPGSKNWPWELDVQHVGSGRRATVRLRPAVVGGIEVLVWPRDEAPIPNGEGAELVLNVPERVRADLVAMWERVERLLGMDDAILAGDLGVLAGRLVAGCELRPREEGDGVYFRAPDQPPEAESWRLIRFAPVGAGSSGQEARHGPVVPPDRD